MSIITLIKDMYNKRFKINERLKHNNDNLCIE